MCAAAAFACGCALPAENVGDQHPCETSTGAEDPSGTGSPQTTTGEEPTTGGEVVETHVVLLDCGVELACEPLRQVVDLLPPSGQDCAQALLEDGHAGLVSVAFECDGDPIGAYEEQAILVLDDGRAIRQRRLANDGGSCIPEAWRAWGAHEVCLIDGGYFAPDSNFYCQPTHEWSCDEVMAAVMP